MIRPPRTAVAAALCALAAAGCGVGAGDDAGEVELTVTRHYGAEQLIEETEPISEADTVMRALDRTADVETRYGGGFVQSIDGLAGGSEGGRRSDWFFFVNGIESPIGAAEFDLSDGDRVWWDHRDWTAAMRVPAVVGAFPEPFLHGFRGERYETRIVCLTARATCDVVDGQLKDGGATVTDFLGGEPATGEMETETAVFADGEDLTIDVIIGSWNRIRVLPGAELLAEGPVASGVFASFTGPGPVLLNLLNRRGEPAGSLGKGAGLVAAVRRDERPPTWIVTGTDREGVEAAAGVFGDPLKDRYAVAVDAAGSIGVPVP